MKMKKCFALNEKVIFFLEYFFGGDYTIISNRTKKINIAENNIMQFSFNSTEDNDT